MYEVELILSKLKIVSEEQERGLYLCDKEHSKLLLDYITNLQQENERLNNIINELEKDLNKIVALGTITQKQVGLNMLDKLKELKEKK